MLHSTLTKPITALILSFSLTLLIPATASGNDSSLYENEIPPNSAFIRLVYVGKNTEPSLKSIIAQSSITLAPNIASPYVALKAGKHTFNIAGTQYSRKLGSGQHLNMAFHRDPTANKITLLGEVSSNIKARSGKNTPKARLHLLNFLGQNQTNLETGDGKYAIIQNVSGGTHKFREVNPIATTFRISAADQIVMLTAKQQLKERLDYSFMIFEGTTSPIAIFSVDQYQG